jgi:hypothetical protein
MEAMFPLYVNSMHTVETRVIQLFSSPELRIVFQFDPRAKKPQLAQFFKTNSQFVLSLTILIQKWQITIVGYMFKYKCYWNVHTLGWCLRLVAVGLASYNDLKSYAGGSVAIGRVSQAVQVKGEVPD